MALLWTVPGCMPSIGMTPTQGIGEQTHRMGRCYVGHLGTNYTPAVVAEPTVSRAFPANVAAVAGAGCRTGPAVAHILNEARTIVNCNADATALSQAAAAVGFSAANWRAAD